MEIKWSAPPLHLDDAARAVWREVLMGAHAAQFSAIGDKDVLAAYCTLTVKMRHIMSDPPMPVLNDGQGFKRNPDFSRMLAVSRILSAIECAAVAT